MTIDAEPDTSDDAPFFPGPRSAPLDPPPSSLTLLAAGPITRVRIWDDSEPWFVAGYTDGRRLLGDPNVSADTERANYPHQNAAVAQQRSFRTFIGMDDPDHSRYRQMVTADFRPTRSDDLRPAIQAIVDDLLDGLEGQTDPIDLIPSFCLPVPSRVISLILGVPYADHELFESCARNMFGEGAAEDSKRANETMGEYLRGMLDSKIATPTDDLFSRVAAEMAAGNISPADAVNTLVLILAAGHDTTAHQLALGVLVLLQHPDQLAEFKADPTITKNAVDEILRVVGVTHLGRRRVATADLDFQGVTIKAGDGIVVPGDLSNRDERVFPDPHRFDLHRANAPTHVTFGSGPHTCLGQHLARVELQVTLASLFARFPDLRLAVPIESLQFKERSAVYGPKTLPVLL